MIAHQFKIREEKSKTEILDFDHTKCDLKNTKIKLIDKSLAKKIVIEYEWLKTIPHITRYHFGLYFNVDGKEVLGGVLVFSDDYTENIGVWDKYGFSDKLILLSRGVCLWWTPKNSASYFISRACKWLKENTHYRIVTATVDPAAGEIGTIYQSLNWYYVGLMSGNYTTSRNEYQRFSVLINGKLRYSRSIRREFGTMKKDVILQKYPDAIFLKQYRKRRYFYFMDSKLMNKKYYDAIKHLILEYPKRSKPDIIGLIYMIRNKINNKVYIGQTTRSLNSRIIEYKNGYSNPYLKKSFNKYEFENFEFSIIETIHINIDDLNEREKYWINYYKSNNKEFGYNLEEGGKNSSPSPETLEKMSIFHQGIKQREEWINRRIAKAGTLEAKKYGKPKSDEEKQYLSINSPKFWLGKKCDEVTKEKIRQTKLMKGLSEKQKEVICKKVIAYNPQTNEILHVFESTTETANFYKNISQSTISRRCSGVTKNKGDVYFRYLENT